MSEFELWEKAVLGTGGAAGAVVLLFKVISLVRKEQVGQAGDAATLVQFKSLQEQLTLLQKSNTELHAQFQLMDSKLHRQQRTITRMEMLLRQFSGLVQEKGIPVPAHMTSELTELIDNDAERNAAVILKRRKDDV